jgi:leader peptidase (prepilin peptidase)/N-methyltransferase
MTFAATLSAVTSHQLAFIAEAALLGLVAGWGADRIGDNCPTFLEEGMLKALAASYCQRCQSPPPWWLHLPVAGRLLAKGRCPACGVGLHGLRLPLELAGAMAFATTAAVLGPSAEALAAFVAITLLLACLATDLYASVIPTSLTNLALWAGLLAAVFGYTHVLPEDAIVGAAVTWGGLRLVQTWGLVTRGAVSLGNGDLHLLAVGGAWGGLMAGAYALVIASALAIAHTTLNHLQGRSACADKPFGPWLTIAIWITLLARPYLQALPWSA